MGRVYRARDPRLGREVAIKVLPEDAVRDRTRLERFTVEARTIAALNHPNILTLYEIGESPEGPYLVTELVAGESIRALLHHGPLPAERALDLAWQTASGLARAHAAGIVHRDVKPDNLMVTRDGFVKILDFGLAKLLQEDHASFDSTGLNLTATGVVIGSPAYLSPEQLRAQPVDARSDLFALGIVMHEMLQGTNPFLRRTAAETLHAILGADAAILVREAASLPVGVGDILRRTLARDPAARFRDAQELADALKPLVHASGAVAAPARRRPALVPWIAAGALLLVIALVFTMPRLRASRPGGAPPAAPGIPLPPAPGQ